MPFVRPEAFDAGAVDVRRAGERRRPVVRRAGVPGVGTAMRQSRHVRDELAPAKLRVGGQEGIRTPISSVEVSYIGRPAHFKSSFCQRARHLLAGFRHFSTLCSTPFGGGEENRDFSSSVA